MDTAGAPVPALFARIDSLSAGLGYGGRPRKGELVALDAAIGCIPPARSFVVYRHQHLPAKRSIVVAVYGALGQHHLWPFCIGAHLAQAAFDNGFLGSGLGCRGILVAT